MLFSCADDGNTGVVENLPPAIPELNTPDNYELIKGGNVEFSWDESLDPEHESVSYNLQISRNIDFTDLFYSNRSETNSYETELKRGVPYYWRVRAMDQMRNTSDFSGYRQIYLDDPTLANYKPFAPELISPVLNDTLSSNAVLLQWSCYDIDDDPLTYDIFLSENYPPDYLISTGQSGTSLHLSLESKPVYYWRVVAKDLDGAENKSPIWYFKTDL
ncbi:hypothetical protein DMZ48_05940 [Robertkochia solimangrovi]|nr:hypothetical protein DMZ48_05940 [Robertkochia solimangrovi]